MPQGPVDAVRAYELPNNAPGQVYLSQYNLASNAPVMITPGFGGSGGGQLPPIVTGSGHFDCTVTYYLDQARTEQRRSPSLLVQGGGARADRKAHVKRVFAVTGQGQAGGVAPGLRAGANEEQLDPDIWVDVLRIDSLPVLFQSRDDGLAGQTIQYIMHWNDDPSQPESSIDSTNSDSQGENANAARKTQQITIRDPDNPDDADQLKLWIVDKLRISTSDYDRGAQGIMVDVTFKNTQPDDDTRSVPPDRDVHVVKIVNNDLGGLTMADDDGSNPSIVNWEQYLKALQNGERDDTQTLDVEITDKFRQYEQPDQFNGYEGQLVTFTLPVNRDIERMFDAGNPKAQDANGNPSLIRTDPLQCIVNVGFGGLAVEFGDHDQDSPGDRGI